MSKLPVEIRKQLKRFVSETTDVTLDLVVNLSGKYLSEVRRAKLKEEVEREVGQEIEEGMANAYQIMLKLAKKYQLKELERDSLKEQFYSITDAVLKPLLPDIPKNVHAMDYFFEIMDDLHRDFRFITTYLVDTKYFEYLRVLEELIADLKKKNKLGRAFDILKEFKNSNDAYILVQVTLQKLIKDYEYLQCEISVIKKKHMDKYLEIYEELSGVYEKLVSLIRTLIHLLNDHHPPRYETVRKKGLNFNIQYIKKTGWGKFSYGFNRNMRNSIVHKTYKVDILKEKIEFIDRTKTITLTFQEIQKKTRELSALILLFPHVFISIFCAGIASFKEQLQSDLNSKSNRT